MIIIAVDLGRVRTGVAVCDPGEILASPVTVVTEQNEKRLCEKIHEIAQNHRAQEIVLGLPRNMDGTEGESARHAREFGKKLQARCGLPVVMRDERGTTVTATGYLNETNLRGKARKQTIDAVAATVILQDYLDYRRNYTQRSAENE
ncbi:MAG: Holliday junction resolvase RuvX [Oscillospiraceae bacterium]|nr:Holliday junction resolvase RuvX [Oscillospiraceae bacterium]